MFKGIAFLYFVCLALYIIYSREPDFFDGEIAPATIRWQQQGGEKIPKAFFIHDTTTYSIDARYLFRSLPENKKLQVIYMPRNPNKATVYSWWGYWIKWGELLMSIILIIALFQVAVAVTKNPTPEALLEQLSYTDEKKKKYND